MDTELRDALSMALMCVLAVLFIGITGWAFFSSIFGAYDYTCEGMACPISISGYFMIPLTVFPILFFVAMMSDKPKKKRGVLDE